jgi:hypothetical protein
MHRELLQGRDVAGIHMTPKFEPFIVAAARRMTARGLEAISEFWRDRELFMSSRQRVIHVVI